MIQLLVALVAGGLLLLGPVFRSEAAIYVYVDESGITHFTNRLSQSAEQPPPASSPPAVTRPIRGEFTHIINHIAAEHGVDPKLVHAVIKTESNFDPLVVSQKGAQGLMQLMPATAVRYAVADIFEPEANIRGGVRYLRDLQSMFPGELSLALAAYNAGEQVVRRYKGIPPYPETRQFVQRVLKLYMRDEAAPEEAPAAPFASPFRP